MHIRHLCFLPAPGIQPLDVIVFFYGRRDGGREALVIDSSGQRLQNRILSWWSPTMQISPGPLSGVCRGWRESAGWVYDHIAGYHGNPERIHVAGHSSGAHIGALLTAMRTSGQ